MGNLRGISRTEDFKHRQRMLFTFLLRFELTLKPKAIRHGFLPIFTTPNASTCRISGHTAWPLPLHSNRLDRLTELQSEEVRYMI
jgi:hypothetical protein